MLTRPRSAALAIFATAATLTGGLAAEAEAVETHRTEELSVPITGGLLEGAYTWLGDFNGDGIHDIATASGTRVRIWMSSGNTWRTRDYTTENRWGHATRSFVGDFDGDGHDETASCHNSRKPSAQTVSDKPTSEAAPLPSMKPSATPTNSCERDHPLRSSPEAPVDC